MFQDCMAAFSFFAALSFLSAISKSSTSTPCLVLSHRLVEFESGCGRFLGITNIPWEYYFSKFFKMLASSLSSF